jgi:hypothetical protein
VTYYQEQLVAQAEASWQKGEIIPLTLFISLLSEGLDPHILETKYTTNNPITETEEE